MKSHIFVDTARVFAIAGRGGNGCLSFRREKSVPLGGPDGGDGGRGGHVIFQANHDVDSLIAIYYRPHQRAEDGGHGKGKRMHGRNGQDLIVKVPCGTEINIDPGGDQPAGSGAGRLADLIESGAQFIAAHGGKGGNGNCHWKTSVHRAPMEHTAGEPGEERTLRLDLKLVADAGLIGLPNAGKSSLLGAISHAHPKIAPYPFTTLNPVIGALSNESLETIKIVDIPGLVQDAHQGVGLGYAFLRHVERAGALVFVIDMAGADGRNPTEDYRTLRSELKLYNPDLAKRPALVVANKMDLPEAAEFLAEFIRRARCKPIPISAKNGTGLEPLKRALFKLVRQPSHHNPPAERAPVKDGQTPL